MSETGTAAGATAAYDPIARVVVNRHVIAGNAKCSPEERQPPFSVKVGKDTIPTWEVAIVGPMKLLYKPDSPLNCGATAYMEGRLSSFSFIPGERNRPSEAVLALDSLIDSLCTVPSTVRG